MLKVATYTLKGTKTKDTTLPKGMFEAKPNLNLLAHAVYVYEERSHSGLRKTKTRSEVNRTTKKIYKQKGTGGARHGSRRAPIFVGGGIALGPRPVRRILKLPQGIKNKAKAYAFSLKADQKEVFVASGLSKVEKTKEISGLLDKIAKETGAKSFTFVLSEKARDAVKFFRNLGNAVSVQYKDVNAFDIVKGGIIILDEAIFEAEKPAKAVKKEIKPVKKKVKTKK
ncbi:MAG TPA: 50S ribosomal protein L4 [Patescibacteria group bacterium]|nr:50S ribosomal protein L4 [Patescibacteria group bacterium]